MNVTVFGGARPQPGEYSYDQGILLGKLLAQAGHTVLTGGYKGVMESVSRGAAEAGGHVIGITCAEIEKSRKTQANPWVKEEWKAPTLMERLNLLVNKSDAAIALPGGIGTLVEISLYWNLLLINALPPHPLVLVGAGWQDVLNSLKSSQGEYIHDVDWRWVSFAPTVEEAAKFIIS